MKWYQETDAICALSGLLLDVATVAFKAIVVIWIVKWLW